MKREAKIGIFAVVILLCLWAGIRFLSGIDIFGRTIVYYADYANVSGLQSAAPVTIQGVKVGTVEAIEFDPSADSNVRLSIAVNRRYRIPADSRARIYSDGFLGGKAVAIELGSSAEMLPKGGLIESSADRDLMDVAGSELEMLKGKVVEVTESLTATLQTLNALLEENTDNLTATIGHVNSITASLDGILASERKDIEQIVASMNSLAATLEKNTGRIDGIIGNADRFTSQLADARIDSLASALGAAAAGLDRMLARIDSGDGSLGQLLNDQRLYDNLTEASANLSALLGDLKQNPKRYVHFSLFGGKDKDKSKTKTKNEPTE